MNSKLLIGALLYFATVIPATAFAGNFELYQSGVEFVCSDVNGDLIEVTINARHTKMKYVTEAGGGFRKATITQERNSIVIKSSAGKLELLANEALFTEAGADEGSDPWKMNCEKAGQ